MTANRHSGADSAIPFVVDFVFGAWRYHPENGQPLIESAPLGASDADLQGLAAKFPECMRDLGKANCRINYSIEIGCTLDPVFAKECKPSSIFASLLPPVISAMGARPTWFQPAVR